MELRDGDGLTEREFLENYRPGDFERPSVAVDMVIFTVTDADEENYRKLPQKELRVLLIQRGRHPFLGRWALPGGFVRPYETVGQAAARELQEEAGLAGVYLEQLLTFSEPERDPRMRVMSCAHMALINSEKVRLRAGDDADRAEWFQICERAVQEHGEAVSGGFERVERHRLELAGRSTVLCAEVERHVFRRENAGADRYSILSNDGLAFDHAKLIVCALERLRRELEHSDLVFYLMPELFTLTELQQVYEAVLDCALYKAAFRRKMAPLVVATDQFTENAGHRPSRLYRRNPAYVGPYA